MVDYLKIKTTKKANYNNDNFFFTGIINISLNVWEIILLDTQ